jgi:hypothetical protein
VFPPLKQFDARKELEATVSMTHFENKKLNSSEHKYLVLGTTSITNERTSISMKQI